MSKPRRQLSLFLKKDHETIERIRAAFNPAQYKLIPAHVTLCREDELDSLEQVKANLTLLHLASPFCLQFSKVVRFPDGKGAMLAAQGANQDFHNLRKRVLQGVIHQPRVHHPHITLLHPRNSTCDVALFERLSEYKLPKKLYFDTLSLIEQGADEKWKILNAYILTNKIEN